MCGCGGSGCSACRGSGPFGLRRTLVTLDLSAYDTVRLVKRLQDNNPQDAVVLSIAKQIEAQTKPPEPPEPTGLGAVVEASCVHSDVVQQWVRSHHDNWHPEHGYPDDYGSLRNVRVLSEGVTA